MHRFFASLAALVVALGLVVGFACAKGTAAHPLKGPGPGPTGTAQANDAGVLPVAAGIALAQPIVTSVGNVTATELHFVFGATDAQTKAFVSYVPCTASGQPIAGSTPTNLQLGAADLAVFAAQVGASPRLAALAAAMSAQPSLQGTAK